MKFSSKRSYLRLCLSLALIFVLLLCSFYACATPKNPSTFRHNDPEVISPFSSYKEIPGVTDEEIEAISRLREIMSERGEAFVYGMPESTEAFPDDKGEIKGFSALFCEWLTEIFDIPFEVKNVEFNDLLTGLEDSSIDFTSELTIAGEDQKTHYMTSSIASRVLQYFRLVDSRPFSEIINYRSLKFGFLEGTNIKSIVEAELEPGTYEITVIENIDEVYDMLKSGEIDAFFFSESITNNFDKYYDVVEQDFYPLNYHSVSMSTQNSELRPIITVIQKAIDNNASEYISSLHVKGQKEYKAYKFENMLSDEEKAYLQENAEVNFAAESDNYPISYYNAYDREWQGIAFDVIDGLQGFTGLSFNLINDEKAIWPELFSMLEEGKASMVTELIRTKDREGSFIWPDVNLVIDRYILATKADHRNISTSEIYNVRVGVIKNAAHAEQFRRLFPNHGKTLEYDTFEGAFSALERGEIDMVMASRLRLLALSNQFEFSVYKANIMFDEYSKHTFGFGKEEEVLCSIINKGMYLLDVNAISDQWISRTYDYNAKLQRDQRPLLIGLTITFSVIIILLLVMFSINRNVQRRTSLILDATPLACRLWNKKFEILECNEETLRLFNLKDKNDYINKYYDIFPEFQPDGQRSREKIDFVLRKALEEGRYVFEMMHRLPDGTPLPCEVTLVRVVYGNQDIIAGYTRDLREHKRMMAAIEKRDDQLKSMNHVAAILLDISGEEHFDESLLHSMGIMGQCMDADHVQVWRNEVIDEEPCFVLRYQWMSEIGKQKTDVPIGLTFSYKERPEWKKTFYNGQHINSTFNELPEEDREFLKPYDMKSIVMIPLFVDEQFWGFFYIDDCKQERIFMEDEIDILRAGGLMIANALLRYETMQDIREANDAKSSFLASMSHEMRTPLNAILGLAELSLESEKTDDESKENFEKIYSSGETILSIVNDVLDITKIEAGRFELTLNEYAVPSLINDTLIQNILRIGDKPISFILDIDENMPALLYGDDLRIKQILSNLLSNAFKYTKKGEVELSLSCVREGETVWMIAKIRDTGIGIREEDISHLFTNYARMNIRTNRRVEGSGLGLPITKRMAEMMGGTVSVESEFGKGSLFTVMVKQKHVSDDVIGHEVVENLKQFRYTDERRKEKSRFARIKLPDARVLLVDDNITNLDVAKGMMKPYDMKIDCVISGQESIDAIQDETVIYDAIFMDHMMPGMDGIEATNKIREIGTDYAKNIPIIALTANAILGNEQLFLSKGFQAFLSKPINLKRLDNVIRKWIAKNDIGEDIPPPEAESIPDTQEHMLSYRMLTYDITGVDIREALEQFNRDEEILLQVFRTYADTTVPLLEKMKDVDRDKLSDYATIVHGIKGSSRGICAEELGAVAEKLEKAAKSDDFEYVLDNNPVFIDATMKLIASINEMLEAISAVEAKPKKERPELKTLIELKKACENFNIEALDECITELDKYEYENEGELISWLKENAGFSNFTEIAEKLEQCTDEE